MATGVMSSEDFRAHLYHSLQGKGIVNSLKSQLRNKLATELHKTLDGSGVGSSPFKSPRKSMRVQIADSIVAEYLKAVGYEYSLSVFLPEVGISMDKLLSEEDMLQFLRISPSSRIYQHLKTHLQRPADFLERLLEALIESHDVKEATETSTFPVSTSPYVSSHSQTCGHSSPTKKSVADRLEELDISYARRAEEESIKCQLSLEDRLSAFQRDLEARYKQQLESELALHCNRELVKARQEERDRYQEELGKIKENLRHMHQLRLEDVKKSEQRMIEKYRRKEQELEAGIYSQRQTLLNELNALRVKEAGMKREIELDRRAVALEKEQAKTITEQLESNMKQMKTRLELMAEEKVQKGKLEFELKLQSKRDELEKHEAQLKMDAKETDSMKLESEKLKAELNEQRKMVGRLQAQLQEATLGEIRLQKQKSETQSSLIQFADYNHLKHEVSELRQQVSLSENKYAELKASHRSQQLTIRQQQTMLSQPRLEQASMQAEMEQLRRTHHKQMLVMEYDNKHLERQLAAQSEHILSLQRRLDEQLVQLRSAQREVQDLQSLLEHAYSHGSCSGQASQRSKVKGRLNNKSLNSPSKKQSARSSSVQQQQQQHSKRATPQPLTSHTHMTTLFRDELTSTLGPTTSDEKKERNVSFFDSSGMFLAESRATIDRMEKEAEGLERTYRSFYPHFSSRVCHGDNTLPSLLSTPSPLPDSDFSLPSPYDQSFIGTVATPTDHLQPLHYSVTHAQQSAGFLSNREDHPSSSTADIAFPLSSPQLGESSPLVTSMAHQTTERLLTVNDTNISLLPISTSLAHKSSKYPTPPSSTSSRHTTSIPSKHTSSSLPSVYTIPVLSEATTHLIGADSAVVSLASASTAPPLVAASNDPVTSPPLVAASAHPLVAASNGVVTSSLVAASNDPVTSPPLAAASNSTAHPLVSASNGVVTSSSSLVAASNDPVTSPPLVAARRSVVTSLAGAFSIDSTPLSNATAPSPPKSIASLDSWWKSSSADTANLETFSLKLKAESADCVTLRTTLVDRPPVMTSTSFPAETRLTGITQTPILSLAPEATVGAHRELEYVDKPESEAKEPGKTIDAAAAAAIDSGGVHAGNQVRQDVYQIGASSSGLSMEDSALRETSLVEPPSIKREMSTNGAGSLSEGKKAATCTVGKDFEEEVVDSVMLKYMQLVQEKRRGQETQHQPNEEYTKEFDIPPLSQDISGFDGLSNHEDDPFEDW